MVKSREGEGGVAMVKDGCAREIRIMSGEVTFTGYDSFKIGGDGFEEDAEFGNVTLSD